MKMSTRLTIFILFAGITLSGFHLLVAREGVLQQQIRAQELFAETLLQGMNRQVTLNVANGHLADLTKMLQSAIIHDNNPVEYIYVVDKKGLLLAHSYANALPDFLKRLSQKETLVSNDVRGSVTGVEYIVDGIGVLDEYEMSLKPSSLGRVIIGVNHTEIVKAIGLASQQVLIMGFFITFFCTCLAWFLVRFTIRPIEKLSNTLDSYQHGDTLTLTSTKHDVVEVKQLNSSIQAIFQSKKYYENTLMEREQDLERILNSIGDAVIVTDPKGCVTRMNPVAETLTGWSIEQAHGQSIQLVMPLIHAESREPITNPADTVLARGETVYLSSHTTLKAKDGREYQISDSASPIRDVSNNISGMVLVFNDETEQHALRLESKRAQHDLERIFDNMQTMIGVLDADARITMLGIHAGVVSKELQMSMIGKKFYEGIWFAYDPTVKAIVEDSCRNGVNGQGSQQDILVKTDIGFFWVSYFLQPIFDAEGNVIQILVEGVNIDERKKLEEEMYASVQHLKLYRDQTPIAAIEWNLDFEIINWNEAAEKMMGYSFNEVKKNGFIDTLLPQLGADEAKKRWRTLFQNKELMQIRNQTLHTKNGRTLYSKWYNSPLIDPSGQPIGSVSLVIDMTDEFETKKALEEKELLQREILSALTEGVVTADEKGRILSFNQAAEKLFGLKQADAIGQSITVLMPESEHVKREVYSRTIRESEKKYVLGTHEMLGWHKEKHEFPMRLSISILPSVDGRQRLIGSCVDLTQVKSQQAQLQRAQKMDALGKLVGGIAHDYNNMLGVILGYTSLMEMKFGHVEGLQKYLENINEAGERGRRLTKRMLSFSKQESSQSEACILNNVLELQKDLFSKSLTAMIKINYKLCDSSWLVWVDKSEFEDTLLNLVINAKHAMPNGGELTFTTKVAHIGHVEALNMGLAENDYISLSISDTGCGIDSEILGSIFDPFFSTKGSGGTGLGLSQVYGFIERAGGTIKVYSEKNSGTEFTLFFPRHLGVKQDVTTTEKVSPLNKGDGQIILVVDDEPGLRELAKEILIIAGYQVLTAHDGNDAIDVLTKKSVDLVLSDVIMPNLDGYQLANYIQENYPGIKIQLASGFSDNRHIALSDKALYETMLHKPYNTTTLLNRISSLFLADDNE